MAQATNMRIIEDIPEFTTEADTEPRLQQRFRMDGEIYTLNQPKATIALTMIRMTEANRGKFTADELTEDVLMLTRQILLYIEEEPPAPDGSLRGQALIWHRLNDVKDPLDLKHLAPAFSDLIGKVFERPTGSRPASARKPRATSKGSVGGSRSTRAAISGN